MTRACHGLASDPLEQFQHAIENRVITPVFNDCAGMRNGGAIACKQRADIR